MPFPFLCEKEEILHNIRILFFFIQTVFSYFIKAYSDLSFIYFSSSFEIRQIFDNEFTSADNVTIFGFSLFLIIFEYYHRNVTQDAICCERTHSNREIVLS